MAIKTISFPRYADDYVFIPACCYAGNQFRVLKEKYPPMFPPEQASVDMPVTITDVPRLEPDGTGKIEVTTGDAAVPCIGVFSPARKQGILVFTVQQLQGRNIGLAYENGEIRLTWPAKREKIYRMCRMEDNPEKWVDGPGEIPSKILEFPCDSLAAYFRTYFENRKCMGLDDERPVPRPVAEQFAIQRDKFNAMNWYERLGIYTVGTELEKWGFWSDVQVWQPGWIGGGISGYALMCLGGELEWERELKTLDFLISTQCESGFFAGLVDGKGKRLGDGFDHPGTESWHLIRKSADALYFLFKHFRLMQERKVTVPEHLIAGAKKAAECFVKLYGRYGQFGQFVNVHTGEIIAGGSASGAIAPAALVEAYRFFGDEDYLRTALESAEGYYQNFLSKGYTTGGPGEMLQCVDSESGFGLLESYVRLYEVTRDEKWLKYARECAHYCSSWVVAYNYVFPPHSEFGRHGKKTVGTVFANLQNKHSAPGICTLSGDSLYKLWKYTGDALYLELLRDIALAIGQYLSTDEEPIYDWGLDLETRKKIGAGADPQELEEHRLPTGFINERVNMSDWEGDRCVGGVFYGSCWSETSNLLTLAEVMPLLYSQN